jgi:hypothetical protein
MYVLKEEDTNIIRGIPQIYNENINKNNRWLQASHRTENRDLIRFVRETNTTS